MRDVELYRHLLGLESPWAVSRVELSVGEGRVDVWADHPRGTRWACPECQRELSTYDHAEERAWRHLDSCQFLTYFHARPPRVDCPEHGVRQVALPWAGPMARFTHLFERLAVDVLKECDVLGAARLLRTSWDETWHLMQRAVARGLAAKEATVPAHVGVDEKSAGRGQDYITVVSDLDGGTVEHIADERRQSSLDSYFEKLTTDRQHRAQAGEPCPVPRRRQEPRGVEVPVAVLRGEPPRTPPQALRHPARHGPQDRPGAIKENLRNFWEYRRRGWGERHFKSWYFWATHSRLQPVIEAARTLKRHEAGLIAYFSHRITNAAAEGLNSRIQAIRVSARGYRNRENFKTAIFFHRGGLQLYPQTH